MPKVESESLVWANTRELKTRSKQWVLRRRRNVCDDEQARMPDGSEFQTEGTAMLKPREAEIAGEPTTDWCWRSLENVQGCGN